MTGVAIGLFFGTYLNNPALRRTVDGAIKKALAYSIDTLNGQNVVTEVPQKTTEDE